MSRFIELLREANEIVRNKPTWKRFISGTPLANDVAVWMADFAAGKTPDYDTLAQRCRELEAERDEATEANQVVVSTSYKRLLENDALRAEVERLRGIRDVTWEMIRTSQALGGGEIVCRGNFNEIYRLLRAAGAAEPKP